MPVSVARAECPMCERFFCVSAAGHLYVHGPRSDRCPGSNHVVSVLTLSSGVASLPLTIANTVVDCSSTSAPASSPPQGLPSSLPPTASPFHLPGSSSSPVFQPFRHLGIPIIKRLPKGSHFQASAKFMSVLEDVIRYNSPSTWERLLSFAPNHLYIPRRGDSRWSLASMINNQLQKDAGPPEYLVHLSSHKGQRPGKPPAERLRVSVPSRLEEGDTWVRPGEGEGEGDSQSRSYQIGFISYWHRLFQPNYSTSS